MPGGWIWNGIEVGEGVGFGMEIFFGGTGKKLIWALGAMNYLIGHLIGEGRGFLLGLV